MSSGRGLLCWLLHAGLKKPSAWTVDSVVRCSSIDLLTTFSAITVRAVCQQSLQTISDYLLRRWRILFEDGHSCELVEVLVRRRSVLKTLTTALSHLNVGYILRRIFHGVNSKTLRVSVVGASKHRPSMSLFLA